MATTIIPARAADAPCLVFYHVGKTGGTALHRWIRMHRKHVRLWTHYGGHRESENVLSLKSDRGPAIPVTSADVIMGHFRPSGRVDGTFGAALRAAGVTKRCFYWTLLREPLSRTSSALTYLYPGRNGSFLADCVGASERTAPGPCARQRGRHASLRNEYCSTFSPQAPHWNKWRTRHAEWDAFCNVEAAKRQLTSLDGISFFEDGLDQTARVWAKLLGLPANASTRVPRINAASKLAKRMAAHADVQRLVERHNRKDVELYQWARTRMRGIAHREA